MADEVNQEIREGAAERKRRLAAWLKSPLVIAIAAGALILAAGAAFMLTPAGEVRAEQPATGNDPHAFLRATAALTTWSPTAVWVQVSFGKSMGERKITMKLDLIVTRELMDAIKDQRSVLDARVAQVMRGVLYSRAVDVRTDPKQAESLISEEIKRALLQGVDPLDAERRIHLPFTERNLKEVVVRELELSMY